MAQIDENRIQIGTAVTDDASLTPEPLLIDPVTGGLLVIASSSAVVATAMAGNKRDEDREPTVYGVSDDDGVTLVPIRTDGDGKLLVDV